MSCQKRCVKEGVRGRRIQGEWMAVWMRFISVREVLRKAAISAEVKNGKRWWSRNLKTAMKGSLVVRGARSSCTGNSVKGTKPCAAAGMHA